MRCYTFFLVLKIENDSRKLSILHVPVEFFVAGIARALSHKFKSNLRTKGHQTFRCERFWLDIYGVIGQNMYITKTKDMVAY